ncbi:MAG TPA: hypothetical protein PLU93_09100, partial [Treponemataceae bacterium]|nr:hypothetical protein [Treponemataceae bacterium]
TIGGTREDLACGSGATSPTPCGQPAARIFLGGTYAMPLCEADWQDAAPAAPASDDGQMDIF